MKFFSKTTVGLAWGYLCCVTLGDMTDDECPMQRVYILGDFPREECKHFCHLTFAYD